MSTNVSKKKRMLAIVFAILISFILFYSIFNFFNSLFSSGTGRENLSQLEKVDVCYDRVFASTDNDSMCFENPFSIVSGRPPFKSEINNVYLDIKPVPQVDEKFCACILSEGNYFHNDKYIDFFISNGKSKEIDSWVCFDKLSEKSCIWS